MYKVHTYVFDVMQLNIIYNNMDGYQNHYYNL